jgi:hypothetical protein
VRIAAVQRHLPKFKPFHCIELCFIKTDFLAALCMNNVPERHINMTGSQPNSCGARDHERRLNFVGRCEAELFLHLPHHCVSRMLVGLDVPARRQPKLGIFMVDEKNVAIVHNRKIRNQMLWRSRRLGEAAQLCA